MRLRGPTISLRLPDAADAPALFELASDPEVAGWFSWGPYREPAQPARWIAGLPAAREDGVALDLVIEREGTVLGVTALNELSARDRRAMVGSWLGRASWGTGVNTEAKALVCHLGFVVCGLDRIGAYANVQNTRSRAALEKLGWRWEGTLRRWHRHHGQGLDVHVLGLLREEWEAGPLRNVPVTREGEPPAVWSLLPAEAADGEHEGRQAP